MVSDLNGDGSPDVAIGGAAGAPALFNQGNGTFAAAVDLAPSVASFTVISADLNTDGRPDLVYESSANIRVLFNLGGGSFSSPALYGGGPFYQGIGAGDLDGDGRPERLYVVAVDDDSADIPRRFSGVLIDWGQGPKVVLSRAATPGEEHAVRALADLDHDGRRELVIDERWNDGYDLGLWRLTEARALERMAGIDCDR